MQAFLQRMNQCAASKVDKNVTEETVKVRRDSGPSPQTQVPPREISPGDISSGLFNLPSVPVYILVPFTCVSHH